MSSNADTQIVRGILVGQKRPSDITIQNGKVTRIDPATRGKPDIGSATSIVGPTLFDIQVNGIAGIDLDGRCMTPGDVAAVGEKLAAWGVSHWIPTINTALQKHMERGCRVIAEAFQDTTVARAVPGIHIEGPYISPVDGPRGAHPKRHVRKPSIREFDRLMEAADGKIAYVTVAAEVEGAIPFIKAVVRRGVVAALGHQDADPETINRAVDAGARLSTHLGNGLAAMIPRHVNPLWPQLADDRLKCSLIADLAHLPAYVLKALVRAKRPENVVLTSDVVHLAGLKPGKYNVAGASVELKRGRTCLSGTGLLAGSVLMLLQGVVNAARVTDMTLAQAFASASTIPANLLGLRHSFSLPQAGRKANLVVFDVEKTKSAWTPAVRGVFINGRRIKN